MSLIADPDQVFYMYLNANTVRYGSGFLILDSGSWIRIQWCKIRNEWKLVYFPPVLLILFLRRYRYLY